MKTSKFSPTEIPSIYPMHLLIIEVMTCIAHTIAILPKAITRLLPVHLGKLSTPVRYVANQYFSYI